MHTPKIGVIIPTPLLDRIIAPADRARLEALGEVAWYRGDKPPSVEETAKLLGDCDVALGSWGTPHPGDAAILAACPRLRLWMHLAGTVKSFFSPALDGRDLTIASCKGAIADSVSEFTVGLAIVGLRRLCEDSAAQRRGENGKPEVKVLATSTVGIVGASEVGRQVAERLRPFGPRILVSDPFLSGPDAAALGVERADDLLTLCRDSDVVTLHTPLLDSTRGLLDATHFQAMRDDAIFINTSRGQCVVERDLIAELSKGRLFAFLDVTDPEPAEPDSPLRSLPNVALSSHTAGPATPLIGRQAVDDVAAWLRGDAPRNVITREMLARIA